MNVFEDVMGVYSVLGIIEDGRGVVVVFVFCVMVVNIRKRISGLRRFIGIIWKCLFAVEVTFFKSL